ncbi:MAG: RidA family protein [Thermoplasmatota archaeon]
MPAKLVFVGGQNAVGKEGNLVGKGDLAAQTVQALRNVEAAVKTADGRLEDVVKWTVYITQGQDARAGFAAFQQVWGTRPDPPAVTGIFVQALARPDYLVEIEAVAAV